jgi:hypothetical protein
MTYIPDLAHVSYMGIEGPIRAVGWLEVPYPYRRGAIEPTIAARLIALIERPIANFFSMGLHWCSLCAAEGRCGPDSRSSQWVLLVPGVDCLYEAPIWIGHYVLDHGYQPPEAFCRAVMQCPAPGSKEFRRALLLHVPAAWPTGLMFSQIDAQRTRRPDLQDGDELAFHERVEGGEIEATDVPTDHGSADARLIEEHGGLSTLRCRSSGCAQRALADRALCIDHAFPDRVGKRIFNNAVRRQRVLRRQRALARRQSDAAVPPLRATIPTVTICPTCFVRQPENTVLVDEPFCPHCAMLGAPRAEIVVERFDEFLRRRSMHDFEDMRASTESNRVVALRDRALRLALIAELRALKIKE